MSSKIIILLPVHNRIDVTRRFLECLNRQTYLNWHLVLIDDGCMDGTPEMAQNIIQNMTILKGNGNLWWAGALHLAYQYLMEKREFKDDDIVLIINDDVLIEDNFLVVASDIFQKHKGERILVCAAAVDKSTGIRIPAGIVYNRKNFTFSHTDNTEEVNCFSTRGLFLKFNDFTGSRGFSPKLFPHYYSDYEFSIRLIKSGCKPVAENSLKLTAFFENSGHDSAKTDLSFSKYCKDLFSKRNKSNPIYRFLFIVKTGCFPYNLYLIVRLIVREITLLVLNLLKNILSIFSKKKDKYERI